MEICLPSNKYKQIRTAKLLSRGRKAKGENRATSNPSSHTTTQLLLSVYPSNLWHRINTNLEIPSGPFGPYVVTKNTRPPIFINQMHHYQYLSKMVPFLLAAISYVQILLTFHLGCCMNGDVSLRSSLAHLLKDYDRNKRPSFGTSEYLFGNIFHILSFVSFESL